MGLEMLTPLAVAIPIGLLAAAAWDLIEAFEKSRDRRRERELRDYYEEEYDLPTLTCPICGTEHVGAGRCNFCGTRLEEENDVY